MPYIKPAFLDDLSKVQACAEITYVPYVERIGKKPAPMMADFKTLILEKKLHIAFEGDHFLGFVVTYPKNGAQFLDVLGVFPAHQGIGIGKFLIEFCESEGRRLKFDMLKLYTNEKMTENLSLYSYLGFKEVDRREEDGFSRVYFEKKL